MIESIKLLHYLNESTYKKICLKFGLNYQKTKDNFICFEARKIYRIDMFNISYEQFGHVWFMDLHINFPKFDCPYDKFEQELRESCYELFGEEIMADFPAYDKIACGFIEFSNLLKVENADETLNRLRGGKCVREQLERPLWSEYKKPHGTIEFCLCKENATCLFALARCHGTALKKRIKDSSFHGPVGIVPSKIINEDTEKEIMTWLYKNYGVSA